MVNKVTVVIPNYNGMKFLKDCLDSLSKQSYNHFETLVVDNASTDDSVSFIQSNYPDVKLMIMKENTGFCGGVNAGIKAAKTPYVILLNNDTAVDKNYVHALVREISRSKDIFSVSSKMIQFHNREKLDDAGDLYNIFGWAFQRGVDHPVTSYKKKTEIFSACAGAAIYRRSVFKKIGYFDKMHFAYLEDVDIGYRAQIYGYRNLYCPKAIVYHVGSGTSGSKYNSFKVKLAARNNIYLNYKNMPLAQCIINFIPISIGCLIKWKFFKKIGFEKDYIEGLKEGIKTRKQCNKVPFFVEHIPNYCRIELQLIKNTFIYVWEYIQRKLP